MAPTSVLTASLSVLKEEIDAKKRFITSLPDWGDISTRTVAYERAKHTKQLAEKEYEYELMVEHERMGLVVREHEELYPPITDECPICLEDLRSSRSVVMFACCGNGLCGKCDEAEEGRLNNKCPLCRTEFPGNSEETINQIMPHAENGRSWAQVQVGNHYFLGVGGFPLDKKKGLQWLTLAAEQSNPSAMYNLALIYEGVGVEQSHSKARELMTKAANLGHTEAQFALARWYFYGEAGFSENHSKTLYYATLCCSQEQISNAEAYHYLGFLHANGKGGLKRSLYLAKHYFEKSAEGGCELAYYNYALALFDLCKHQYNGINLPGHSPMPRIIYWLRKAAANGDSGAAHRVEDFERCAKEKCSYCWKEASSINGTLKCCAKCKFVWYCGKECQVKAWKDGHKFDCVKH